MHNFQIRDTDLNYRVRCLSPIYNFCMAHTLFQIQSNLLIISQPKVSFQFLIFKESSCMVFTSTLFAGT